ncbi:HlyD family efflux transporter periplasmic adaptor subunit [Methylobacterium phyllosphaerae]
MPFQIKDLPSIKPNKFLPGNRADRHTRVVRVSAYSVATVLAILMTSATLPPLIADQSDRAVINAPITLMTAPIAGEVTQVSALTGQDLAPGESIAYIHNGRIDQSTLIGLNSKSEELQAGLISARQKILSDRAYIASLDTEIRNQVEQRILTLDGEIAEARAHVAAADAESQSTKAIADRQQALVSLNTASIDLLRPTQHKLAAARFDREAETAKLAQKISELGAVKKGIFVGSQSSSLAALMQKRRDLTYDAERLEIEAGQLAASISAYRASAEAERRRLDSLADATVRAMRGGVVLNLGVAQGRHVNPGDSIATLVDCDQSFAVGIFSYRQGHDLVVGTPITISAAGLDVPRRGWVSEVLPKTSDKTDQLYAVPFPQTERREMYVLVSFDRSQSDRLDQRFAPRKRTSPCSVGEWVTITRENSWIPSASVAWRAVASAVARPVSVSARAISDGVSAVATLVSTVPVADSAARTEVLQRRAENLR